MATTDHIVLSTKKLHSALTAGAAQHHITLIEKDFIAIQPAWSAEVEKQTAQLAVKGIRHAVVTSANAVAVLEKHCAAALTEWNFFCLPGNTKTSLLQSCLNVNEIIAEGSDAKTLATAIIDHGIREIVFFCGNKRRKELPSLLAAAQISCHEIVIYDTIATPAAIDAHPDAVLFFSPSGVESFFSMNQLKRDVVCFAIGDTTAGAIRGFSENQIITSKSADQESLWQSVLHYFNNKERALQTPSKNI